MKWSLKRLILTLFRRSESGNPKSKIENLKWALVAAALLQGCAFNLLRKVTQPEDITPDQIRAYNEVGLDVFMCFQISGPPPGGAMTMFLWPKNKPMGQQFGVSCQIIQGEVRSQRSEVVNPPRSLYVPQGGQEPRTPSGFRFVDGVYYYP